MLDQPHGIPATLGLIEAEEHEQEDILDDHGGLLMQLLAPAPVAPPPPGAGVDAGMQTMHSDVERVVARVKQSHQETVRRSLHALKHVSLCNKSTCSTTYCPAVRKALAHAKTCTVKDKCPACQQVARIMYWHPKACWLAEGVCRIDGCWDGRMRKRADPGSKTQSKAPAPVHVYDGK